MKPVKYVVEEDPRNPFNAVYIEYRGDTGWTITQGGNCLNKDGKWEYEPMPSSRTEEFIKRTRFKDEHEALDFYNSLQ